MKPSPPPPSSFFSLKKNNKNLRMPTKKPCLDWNDTFLNLKHLKESFPERKLTVDGEKSGQIPPFRSVFFFIYHLSY